MVCKGIKVLFPLFYFTLADHYNPSQQQNQKQEQGVDCEVTINTNTPNYLSGSTCIPSMTSNLSVTPSSSVRELSTRTSTEKSEQQSEEQFEEETKKVSKTGIIKCVRWCCTVY